MRTTAKTLYDTDFVEWTMRTAELLREGRFDEVDLEHLAEEVEDLGKSERSAVAPQLDRMLKHIIKQRIQPERDGRSWRQSISDGRTELEYKLEDSPSLRRYLENNIQKIYRRAVRRALLETGLQDSAENLDVPAECPWTVDQLLEGKLSELS